MCASYTQRPEKHQPLPKKRRLSAEKSKSSLDKLPNPNKRLRRNHKNNKMRSVSPASSTKSKKKAKTIKKEYVKCEYLEPLQMTKGSTIKELYQKMSEWSGIQMKDIQIAKIRSKGRKFRKNPIIEDLQEKDKETKLKRVPIEHSDDILVWNQNDGNLAEKELKRRKECIRLSVYIFNKEYPHSIYIESNGTLNDLYDRVDERLNAEEREKICNKGRFRDVDTRQIYRNSNNASIHKLGIEDKHILRFEPEAAPKSNEIVIRYRLKNAQFKRTSSAVEHELYIANNDETATLKTMICSKFEVDPSIYELRTAKVNWRLHKTVDDSVKYIKQCKFDQTQKLILNEVIDKDMRTINIYCQTVENEDGSKRFKIPKCLLSARSGRKSPNKDDDGDVLMGDGEAEEKEKNMPKHDELDVDDENSAILCSLNVAITANAEVLRQGIVDCKELNLNTKLKRNVSVECLRLAVLQKTGTQRKRWNILCEEVKLRGKNGKIIVEFLSKPQNYDQDKNKSGKAMLFVHKQIIGRHFDVDSNECAKYGSRYEIEVNTSQREKLDALKNRIIGNCDYPQNTEPEDIILAHRNYETHKWFILKEEEKKSNKDRNAKKKRMTVKPRLFDRDIVAVINTEQMTEKMIEKIYQNPSIFETEWDRFKYLQYLKDKESKDDDEYNDEPQIKINFDNSSQDGSNESHNHNRQHDNND